MSGINVDVDAIVLGPPCRYLSKPVLRGFLHGLGPFFGNPVKPLVNYIEGNSYPRAYYQ